jgi:hypothetical protein
MCLFLRVTDLGEATFVYLGYSLTVGVLGRGSHRRSNGELNGFCLHQANCRLQPRRHLRLRVLGLHS